MNYFKGIFTFKQALFISILSAVLAVTGIGLLVLFFIKRHHKAIEEVRGEAQEGS